MWKSTSYGDGVASMAWGVRYLSSTQVIRTATGPGGVSGPLRVDLKGNFHPSPLQEYSEHEARSAFTRMLQHHRTNGW